MLAVGTLNAPPRSPSILPTNAPSLSLSISLVITVSLLKRMTGSCATPHKSVDRPNSVIRPIYHRSRISQGTSPGLERQTTGRWRRFFVDLCAEDADLPAALAPDAIESGSCEVLNFERAALKIEDGRQRHLCRFPARAARAARPP